MQRRSILLAVGFLVAVGAGTFAVWAAEKAEADKGEAEQVISMDQVPAKAKEALLKAAGGATITEVEKDVENGTVVYEATWVVDGKEHEAAVTADGQAFEENEADEDGDEDEDEALTSEQVPAKARDALVKLAGANKITGFEKEKIDGDLAYEGEWTANGKAHSACVTADGALIETEETLDAKDVPQAVRDAAAKLLPGAQKLTFEKKVEVEYEISGVVDGKEKEFEVSAAGTAEQEDENADDENGDEEDDDKDEAGK